MMQDFYLDMNIEKQLKEFTLNVQFRIGKGCLGILGPSGCGKSMTLKSIAGIVKPDQGKIYLHHETGDNILYDSSQKINQTPQKRRVGYLFQNYALFPNMTVAKNIASGLRKDQSKETVNEMIHRFHLDGLSDRYPRQLSGGQQQRVALARILAYEPEVILLDEPFSAMDTFLREKLRIELIRVLKEYQGISILVTHDRDEAYQLCDQLLLLDKGQVLAFGPTKEIFENPQYVQIARLTGCKNISRIQRIDDHRLIALDWNHLELEVEKKIDDDITAIGIRAHDFEYVNDISQNPKNLISVGHCEISEMPFEWYITLENGLWWKIEKNIHTHDSLDVIPQYLTIDPSVILLLKDKSL